MILIEALMMLPIVAIDPDDRDLVHAVTSIDGLLWETADTLPAACGAETKLLRAPWPAPVRTTDRKRCPQCREIAGGQASSFARSWWKDALS